MTALKPLQKKYTVPYERRKVIEWHTVIQIGVTIHT